jgi:hypothetical protein
MPAATASLKPLSMYRLDLLDKRLAQLVQVYPVASKYDAVRLTEETIDYLRKIGRFNTSVGVPVGQANEVKRPHQFTQSRECLPGRKPPMNRKHRTIHATLAVNLLLAAGLSHCLRLSHSFLFRL